MGLRRILDPMSTVDAMEFLIDKQNQDRGKIVAR